MASHRPPPHRTSTDTTRASDTSLHFSSTEWQPGAAPLQIELFDLSIEIEGRPRLAKDAAYASAVQAAWREEVANRKDASDVDDGSVGAPFIYSCPTDDSTLHGYVYRKTIPSSPDHSESTQETSLPGIILFHTGAGPQDLFLRWKADSLVRQPSTFGSEGCVVLIADILGDPTGWAWHNREKYDIVRKSLLIPDANGERTKLEGRVRAAVDALVNQPGVDSSRLAAMGYCLGGHPIVELARMRDARVKAMATFHGVFDGVAKLSPCTVEGYDESDTDSRVLVCTGSDDPFVPADDLDAALHLFEGLGYRTEVRRYEKTLHGFSNPAQDLHPSPAFGYSEEVAKSAWNETLEMLKSAVGVER
ncbi:hypothetical protein ACHAXT_001372 [Thalassiosira profunda]